MNIFVGGAFAVDFVNNIDLTWYDAVYSASQ